MEECPCDPFVFVGRETVPVFEREARVKFFVTFEWCYCEWWIRESDNGEDYGLCK